MRLLRRFAVTVAAAALMVVMTSAPASAHAILLRTEPSAQTTMSRAPSAVRLFFSESVEVTFGSVRVFDVDAHRVDAGRIDSADGGRAITVPVGHLRNGTYTSTWRVVSSDGHAVHGGFGFYVGSPSTISAAAVPAENGAGRVVGWGFGAARFAWFAALFVVIGVVVVRRWIWTPAVFSLGLGASPAALAFRRRSSWLLVASWAVLLGSGIAALVFEAASISGLSLARSARLSVLGEVLHTAYGRYWQAATLLTVVALIPVVGLVRRRGLLGLSPDVWIAMLLALTAGSSLTAGLNGHARALPRSAVGVTSVALHLMAVAVWVGGLGVLVGAGFGAWRRLDRDDRVRFAPLLLRRFGRVAFVAVAVVVVTGVANAVLDLAHPSDLWATAYGQVVTAKVVLLAAALGLAARHRWVVPGRINNVGDGRVRRFEWSAAAELALLVSATAAAAGLIALVPGRSLALAAAGPVNLERRSGGYTVQVFLDPSRIGSNQIHLTFVNPQGLGAAEVNAADATVLAPGTVPGAVGLRLIAPGHFVGDVTLRARATYRLTVSAQGASGRFSTQFSFRPAQGPG